MLDKIRAPVYPDRPAVGGVRIRKSSGQNGAVLDRYRFNARKIDIAAADCKKRRMF
jgi:hypothetical protein